MFSVIIKPGLQMGFGPYLVVFLPHTLQDNTDYFRLNKSSTVKIIWELFIFCITEKNSREFPEFCRL